MSEDKKEISLEEISLKDLWNYSDLQRLGYGCKTKIWAMLKNQKFPPPIDDGNGQPRWFPSEVKEHFASRPHYVMSQPKQLRKFQQQHYAVG